MAEVRPFQGIRYNQAIIQDPGSVMSPPHDIIPPQLQQELYQRSEYNFVRLEFGYEKQQDTPEDNRYTRAAATLEEWLKQGILVPESIPAIYIHDYYFSFLGKSYKRRGIVARVRLEEWSKKVVFPHEGTLSHSKTDRLSLLWACLANTSPILSMFQDKKQQIAALLEKATRNPPAIEIQTSGGEGHTVWAITEPGVVQKISEFFADQPLYIADGHHRYESALVYKHERSSCAPASGDEPFNFVMMTLVDFADPGLLVLPPHRLVRGVTKTSLNDLKRNLPAFFDIEELPLKAPGVWEKIEGFLNRHTGEVRLALYGLKPDHILTLKLRDFAAANELMPCFHTEIYKRLDVSVVDHIILEKMMNLVTESDRAALVYSYDKKEAVSRVHDGEFQLALLLSPIDPTIIKAIADAGDRMPRKSTYFFPKEPAGLVFNRLV